jgi:hypothetical protein
MAQIKAKDLIRAAERVLPDKVSKLCKNMEENMKENLFYGHTHVVDEAERASRKHAEMVHAEQDARVAAPDWYTYSKIQPVEVIEEWRLGFHLANVIKYIARAGWKENKLEDLKKARWYLNRKIERIENGEA